MRATILCLLAVAAVGCGGSGTGLDGGSNNYPDLAGARLMSGTYNITGLSAVSDGCMLQSSLPTMTQVTNTGTMLSLGKKYDATTSPIFNPPGYGLGTGPYTSSSTATLTNTSTATLSDGCTYTRSDTSTVQFIGANMLSVDWLHSEQMPSATLCKDPTMDPPAAGCMSEFKFTLSM